MKKTILIFLLFTLFATTRLAVGQTLIINEVSNGQSGAKEFVEFLVTGTCGQTLDIRGYYFDDNCGAFGSTGVTSGNARFTTSATWSALPVGSIIVVYNNADLNVDLPASDPNDANCDGVYVVPMNDAIYVETQPTAVGSACDAAAYLATSGYSTGNWSHIGISNTADGFQLRDASGILLMSVGYGSGISGTTIYFTGSGSGNSYQFLNTTNDDPMLQANWAVNPANGGTTGDSPGSPNNCTNAIWIENLRTAKDAEFIGVACGSPVNEANTNITACGTANVALTGCASDTYSWSSSNTTIATVSGSGQTATITAVDNGTATISVIVNETHSNLFTGPNTPSCSPTTKSRTVNYPVTVSGCVLPCNITNISFANATTCNNNGTNGNNADDYFTADITVTYSNAPVTGTLNLTGDVLPGGGPLSVTSPFNTGSTTFIGVRLSADGTPSVVTATFSADTNCTFTTNNGPSVASCSSTPPPTCPANYGTFPAN